VESIQAGEASVLVNGTLSIPVHTPLEVVVGQEVFIAVRPEKISLFAEAPGPRALPGTVEEVVYIGTDTRYIVRLTERTTLSVRQQNLEPGSAIRFENGASVFLHWPIECAQLLTE
jgi:spermidine/putrescine transport system ATP-binding protein